MRKLMRYGGIALAVGGLIALFIIYLMIPKTVIVFFDNATSMPVIVCTAPQGEERPDLVKAPTTAKPCDKILGSVGAHDILKTDALRPGSHKIRFITDDPSLSAIYTLDLPQNGINRKRRFIYNIRRASHFAIYTLGYGDSPIVQPDIQHLPDRTLFEFNTALELGEGFPETLRVSSSINSSSLTLIGHYPITPEKDLPCCNKLFQSLTHLPEYQHAARVPPPPRPPLLHSRPIH